MRTKLWTGLTLVFFIGVLAGSLGTGFYYKKRIDSLDRHDLPRKTERLTRMLTEELDLREDQKGEIESILRRYLQGLSEMRKRYRPEMEALKARTSEAILAELEDGQKAAFEDLLKRFERVPPHERLRAELENTDVDRVTAELREALGLTDQETSRLRSIMEQSLRERREILEKTEGNPDARHALKRALKEHQNALEERLSKVLSAEQLVAFRRWQDEELHKAGPSGKTD